MKQFKQIVAQSERGQAIVLIALFMIVMLAMVGVAVDGGGLIWLWRNAQNAADTAALQAAYDKCTGGATTWQDSGFRAAEINGFPDQNNPGVDDVVVDLHPVNGTDYVRVRIEATKPKYFIQLVYRGALHITAQALVYCSEAVDFSDLPGMVALGGCVCSGNGNTTLDFKGADFVLEGDMHGNCNVDVNPGGGNHTGAVTGNVTAVGTIDTHNRVTVGGDTVPNDDAIPPPPLIPYRIYFPGGDIWDGINRDTPGMAHFYNMHDGDITTPPSSPSQEYRITGSNVQGLYAVDGHVLVNPASFGPNGLTVVATGKIEYKNTDRGIQNFYYYGWDGENTEDYGVTRRWNRGNGSAILMYSLFNTMPSCTAGQDQVIGWSVGNDPGDIDLDGMVYAPYGGIGWSGARVTVRGPMIAQRIDGSGSDQKWINEPTYLQPMAPVMNNAQ